MSNECECLSMRLADETEKRVYVFLEDYAEFVWIPKKCIDVDDFDREGSLMLLRQRIVTREFTNVDVQLWWLLKEDWFDESEEDDE